MVVLHIAYLNNNACSGVCVVVPQHVIKQTKYATIGFINIAANNRIDGINHQFEFIKEFPLSSLPNPFDKPNLVVFHEVYRPEFIKFAKVLLKAHIPYIIVPHGSLTCNAQKKKRLKKKVANIMFFNSFIRHAKAIQCLSQREADDTKFGSHKFIETNGIQLPQIKKELFTNSGLRFLYIGRLDIFHKGLDLLLNAVKLIKEQLRNSQSKLVLYGLDEAGYFKQLQKFIKENELSDLVYLNHEVIGINKEIEILKADCFIQTSRFEGMPMGILEALSYGLPCLVTSGTTLDKLIVDYNAGWACDTSVESIAETILQAINEKLLLNQKSHNARLLVEDRFEWDNIAKKTIEQYKLLIS